MATSAISTLLAAFKSDPSALPPAVRFIPAAFLFVHAEPLPDGMQPSELEGFAGVTLEGLSPLPIEQLAWGYLTDQKSRHMLIFGAFQDRLNVEKLSADESFYHVLPSFFAAAPADGAAHWVFLWEAGHVAAAHYLAGEAIPSRVEVERLKEDTVAEAFAGRENLLKRLGAHARNEAAPGLLAQPEGIRATRERLNFFFQHYSSPEAPATRVEGHAPADSMARWSADVRGAAFRASEQKRRRTTQLHARFVQVAAAALVLLLISQSVVIAGNIIVAKKQKQINDQAPTVLFVDTRQALLKKISDFTDHQLHPPEMLGTINSLRPKMVTWQKTHIFANDKDKMPSLSITCLADNSETALAFLDSLKQNSALYDLDQDQERLSQTIRGTTFVVNLKFKFNPPAEEMPQPLPPKEELPPEAPAMPDNSFADFQQGGPGFQGGQFAPNPADANQAPVQDTTAVQYAPAPSGPAINFSSSAPPPAPAPAPAPASATDAAPVPAPGG